MTTEDNTPWVCLLCGHVYDPAVGDPDRCIPPGTPLQELPASWTCPDCGASTSDYERVPA